MFGGTPVKPESAPQCRTRKSSLPWEIDAFDAKEAMHRGRDVVLAIYLRDAANAMRLLADLADPKGDSLPQLHFHSITSVPEQPGENLEDEYPAPGPARQLEQAAQYGQGRQVGRYLRELGELLNLMARALSTEKSPLEWKLRFKRARAGRPIDRQKQAQAARDIQLRLRLAKARG